MFHLYWTVTTHGDRPFPVGDRKFNRVLEANRTLYKLYKAKKRSRIGIKFEHLQKISLEEFQVSNKWTQV